MVKASTRAIVKLRGKLRRFVARDALPFAQNSYRRATEAADGLASQILGRDFDERLRRVPLRVAHGQMDPFGMDLDAAKRAVAAAAFLYRVYFRVHSHGVERIPRGRVLLVANHSGQLPLDGVMIGSAIFFEGAPPRFIRSMVEKWTQTLPFVGTLFQRIGQVVGTPENARRLLQQGEAVLVFPEGARGISKPFSQRYELSEFGLGFMRLALETDTPIVPVAVVGAEEQYINLGNSRTLAQLLGMPNFPLVPQWFVPGGQLPLPTKYRIYFGEAMYFDGDADDEDAVIRKQVQQVERQIEQMLDRGLKARKGIFW